MREQCEVRGEDCEVFTRCVPVVNEAHGRRLACPTCAIALGADERTVTALVTWDAEAATNPEFAEIIEVVPFSPPIPTNHPLMAEYVDIVLHRAYGHSVALCQ